MRLGCPTMRRFAGSCAVSAPQSGMLTSPVKSPPASGISPEPAPVASIVTVSAPSSTVMSMPSPATRVAPTMSRTASASTPVASMVIVSAPSSAVIVIPGPSTSAAAMASRAPSASTLPASSAAHTPAGGGGSSVRTSRDARSTVGPASYGTTTVYRRIGWPAMSSHTS